MSKIKKVVMVQPASAGGNFEYMAIPRQGMLFLSAALAQWDGDYLYDRSIWFEDRSGLMDPNKDLDGVDILMVTALINETPRAFQISREARQYHPNLIIIGGGPQMSPLPEEAFKFGSFDVIVNREGEDIIGQLCDVLVNNSPQKESYLEKIPGITFLKGDKIAQLIQTPRRGLVAPDFAELPDYRSIKDLTPQTPLTGGVLETTRGCTENCSYCQVIQQFLGYRLISRETEIKRIDQIRELAEDGLIHKGQNGNISIFISDDLHAPPLRATKFRDERLARLQNWKGHTDNMYMICQARAEVGQDMELANAMQDANIKMLYLGVESDNAENLKLVRKRQDPGQMHTDLTTLNGMGFSVVAMTIIGLPYDTEDSIMSLADWVTEVSNYQTANLLTPLPATSNWTDLQPLNEKGELLKEGEMRPYHLYTGRRFVHYDERWSMQESEELFEKYSAKLRSIDNLYGRIFRMLRTYRMRLAATGRDLSDSIGARIGELSELVRESADVSNAISGKTIETLLDNLRAASQPLSNARTELSENISAKLLEVNRLYKDLTETSKDGTTPDASILQNTVSELDVLLGSLMTDSKPQTESS
tara:strand:- start:10064 stop:11836 length:1773 start_codon:yes stop_codon:yes gene_type:complete